MQDGSGRVLLHGGCGRGASPTAAGQGFGCDVLDDIWYHTPNRDGYAGSWERLQLQLAPAGDAQPLVARAGHSLTLAVGVGGEQHVYIFGGYNNVSGGADGIDQGISHADIAASPFVKVDLQTAKAALVHTAGDQAPTARFGHASVTMWSPIHDTQVMLLFGGASVNSAQEMILLNDTWMYVFKAYALLSRA